MSLHSWLQNLRSALIPGQRHPRQRGSLRAETQRPNLEVLEDRLTPSFSPPTGVFAMQNPPVIWTPDPPLADFTSDGILDQISSNTGEVVVRPGRSDGTFGNLIRTDIPYLVSGAALAVADFNNDGALDVFTSEYYYDAQWYFANVLLGNGEGHFGLWETLQFGGYYGNYIGTGNIFGTGGTDVVYQVGYDFDTGEQFIAVAFNIDDWGPPPPPPPTAPNLSIDPVTITEGNAGAVAANFIVRLSAPTSEAIAVDYATTDGTATGSDYQAASGTLTFAPGETEKTITVQVNGDRLAEPNETFVVNLSNPTNATIADGQGVGTIVDDEPRVSITPESRSEGNTVQSSLAFTVTLSSPLDASVTVDWATADGTAAAGSDYEAASGTLIFPAGESTGTITVLINSDRLAEPDETFVVNLSNPTNATIMNGQATGTILDDEPRISISDVSRYEGRKGRTTLFTFTVTLSAAYDQPITMSFRTVNGTATTSNGDYVAKTGTLTFAPGETTKTITITVKGDSKREGNETFYLDLYGLSGNGLFTKSRGLGTILNDD